MKLFYQATFLISNVKNRHNIRSKIYTQNTFYKTYGTIDYIFILIYIKIRALILQKHYQNTIFQKPD